MTLTTWREASKVKSAERKERDRAAIAAWHERKAAEQAAREQSGGTPAGHDSVPVLSLSAQLQAWPLVAGFNRWSDRHPVLQWLPKSALLILAVLGLPLTFGFLVIVALVDEARAFGWKGALLGSSTSEFDVRRAGSCA